MVDFDKLNRETREYNNRNVSRSEKSRPSLDSLNNQTYKANNGIYSRHYY